MKQGIVPDSQKRIEDIMAGVREQEIVSFRQGYQRFLKECSALGGGDVEKGRQRMQTETARLVWKESGEPMYRTHLAVPSATLGEYAIKESSGVSDYADLIFHTLFARLAKGYAGYPENHREFVYYETNVQRLGIPVQRILAGEFPSVPQIQTTAECKLLARSRKNYTIQVDTWGAGRSLDFKTLQNDDLGGFVEDFDAFGRAYRRTLEERVAAVLYANATSWDGAYAFFEDTHHKNYGTSSLTSALNNLGAGYLLAGLQAIKAQTDIDGNAILGLGDTLRLVHPTNLLGVAPFLCTQPTVPNSSSGLPMVNVFYQRAKPVEFRLLDGSGTYGKYRWYLIENPETYPSIVAGFINGVTAPIMYRKVNATAVAGGGYQDYEVPLMEQDFVTIFHFGIAQADWRGTFGSLATS